MTVIAHRRVAPFGHPRIAGRVLLPLAYRSLPRPSSPSCAQASPTCFRSLDHIKSSSRARAIYDVFNVFNVSRWIRFPRSLPTNCCQTTHAPFVRGSAQDDTLISLLREGRRELQEEK